MSLVATLITHPSNPILMPEFAEQIAKELDVSGLYWLADGVACDLVLRDGVDATQSEAAIRDFIADKPIDLALQPFDQRRKKILIADMDSTMIEQECIDELAAEVGLKEKVSEITARAMNGEIEFESALLERVGLLKGLAISVVDEVLAKRITLMSGGRTLVQTMKQHGAYCALVSGGFTLFTSQIAKKIGFDENRANQLIEQDGAFTGQVLEPILGKQAKVDALNDVSNCLGLNVSDAIAVGDGANDLGMIKLAGTGVALHAKPTVAAQAKFRIDHGDLTALLYLQGFRKADFSE